MKSVVAFIVASLSCSAIAAESRALLPLPPGWRTPTDVELESEYSWRNSSPVKYLAVQGDFDGDHIPDIARLLVSKSGHKYGLVISFGGRPFGQAHQLLESGPVGALSILGIDSSPAGSHNVICGDRSAGFDWCRPGEPTLLRQKTDGVARFLEGKSAYVYYLRGRFFHKVWVSD
ncbi:MAG: hypothetical protein IPO00_02970 [Betaproteobacteria bacterium]|nr:hypothetical protein [Betaproteobacteria bacterium]